MAGRPCASCTHPKQREIDRKLRSGDTIENVVRWLAEIQMPVSVNAVARHRREHVIGEHPPRGRRPVSGDFLQSIVTRTHEALEAGELAPTIRDGIAAQVQLDNRAAKAQDHDLMLKIAQVLGGGWTPPALPSGIVEGEYRELDDERAADEAEFRQLAAG